MIFNQLFDSKSSTYTYIISSGKGREALIIDPVIEHTDEYVKVLESLDLKLVKVIDTHIHADHISGLNELNKRGAGYADDLRKALELTNKSLFLNMVDHTVDIKQDGTVTIDVDYRAYIETALKSTKFNALEDGDLYKERENQILEAKKTKVEEGQKIKKKIKKIEAKENKTVSNVEKKIVKKKTLTTKKK